MRVPPHDDKKTLCLNKVTDRRLQLRMSLWFTMSGALAIGLQFVLTVNTMGDVALTDHATPAAAYEAASSGALRILATTLFVCLPIMLAVGILVSFRVAGPLRRMREFLRATLEGEAPEELHLRSGDELHELAGLLNQVTRPVRSGAHAGREAA